MEKDEKSVHINIHHSSGRQYRDHLKSNKMRIILLGFLLTGFYAGQAQSLILKGVLLNGKTQEPISNAKLFIVGGDKEYQTSDFGEYRLDLSKGEDFEVGDEIEVYIKHETYGFHKERVPIMKNLRYDIVLQPENMVRINGTVLDEDTKDPIQGIEVRLVPEENLSFSGSENALVSLTNKYGGYSFLINRSLIGNQRYANLKLFDPIKERGYKFYDDVVSISSSQKIYLEKELKMMKPNKEGTEPPLTPNGGVKYGKVEFNSGLGAKGFEFRPSPNERAPGKAIYSGDKVKILSKKKSEGEEWLQVEYKGTKGWIKSRYVQI